MFEDRRKWSEGDWRERFGEGDWTEVMKQLVERSDQMETDVRQLRAFISKHERPAVGGLPPEIAPEGKLAAPARLPPNPHINPRASERDEDEDGGRKKRGRAKSDEPKP